MAGGNGSQEAECSPASGLSGLLPNLPSCCKLLLLWMEMLCLPTVIDRHIPSETANQNQSSFSYSASIRYLLQWQEKECKSLWNNSTMSHLKMLLIFWMSVLLICLVITCMLGALQGHKRASDPLRLGVTVLNCQVALGTTWVIWKNRQTFNPWAISLA